MLSKIISTFAVSLALILCSLPVMAQLAPPQPLPNNVPGLLVKANEAYIAKDHQTFRLVLEKLHEMRPNNSDYMYQLVIARALLDDKPRAYELMLKMQQQGLSYDFTKSEATVGIRDTQVFEYVNDLMIKAGEPMGESEPVVTLADDVRMPQAIAWDKTRERFLIGTAHEGSIVAVGKDGKSTELLKANDENGLWAIFDILVDHANNRLWVTSAATPQFVRYSVADKGRSALFEFNLETLELLNRYAVPVDGRSHILGSMVQSPNGDIYIADRFLPIVYRKSVAEVKLEAAMGFKDMISMRGVAMQPDGRIMYIADREMGILVVDVVGGRAAKLAIPDTLNIGGIDGLYVWNNRLIVIQNGISPQRVMRLQLDATGTKVESVRPLAVSQPDFDLPSFGTVQGEDLYYFGNSQVRAGEANPKPVIILRTPLDSNQDLVQPDMQQFMEQMEKSGRTLPEKAGNN